MTRKIPYTLVIGDREVNDKTINYRCHGTSETVSVNLKEFISKIEEDIRNYK